MLRVIFINLAIMFGLLVLVELAFGTWFSETHALHQFTKPRDLRITRENPISDTPPMITYTRDVNGFRGLEASVGEIDLITVGGSTTDQRFLDDRATYQAQLKRLFGADGRDIVIANAGIDGQTSFGHIQNFAAWFDRIDGLKARYILYLVGINDGLILSERNAYDTLEPQSLRLRVQLFIREKSALYQMYLIFRNAVLAPEINHVFDQVNFATAPPFAIQPLRADDALRQPREQRALTALTERIETLATLTRAMGAEPIFVTQRSTAWTRREGKIVGVAGIAPGFHSPLVAQLGPLNGVDIYLIERAVADSILTGCDAAQAICFDLMAELDFDLAADYYDELHTNAAGAAKIAAYLYDKLSNLEGF